jgi:hypothetical protein
MAPFSSGVGRVCSRTVRPTPADGKSIHPLASFAVAAPRYSRVTALLAQAP